MVPGDQNAFRASPQTDVRPRVSGRGDDLPLTPTRGERLTTLQGPGGLHEIGHETSPVFERDQLLDGCRIDAVVGQEMTKALACRTGVAVVVDLIRRRLVHP